MFPIKPMPEINNLDPHATESCPQSASQKFIAIAFSKIVSLWPADSRDWALAMQAELPQMESTQQSLQWLAGGIMSLGKAWWNGAASSGNKKDLAPVKKPGILAALVTVAALAILLIPSAHQGLRAVLTSWRPDRVEAYQAEVLQIARDAESRGDAKTMAFAAMRMATWKDSVSYSNKAVALDPSLTWIFTQRFINDGDLSAVRDWPATLAAWDPGNAVAPLVQAQIRSVEIGHGSFVDGAILRSDPQWIEDGRKALESPRFDSYHNRRLQLDREVFRSRGYDAPDVVAVGVAPFGTVSEYPAYEYSISLLKEAKAALARGDKQTATRDAWTVAHFGEVLRANGENEIERLWSVGYLRSAYKVLQPILADKGRTEEAKMLSQELEAIKPGSPATRWSFVFWSDDSNGLSAATGVLMDLAAAIAVLSSLTLLFAGIWLFSARFNSKLESGALYRTACRIGHYSPTTFLVSLAALAGIYLPSARAISNYLEQPVSNTTMRGLMDSYNAVFYVRRLVVPSSVPAAHPTFWMLVVVCGVLTILTIIGRNIFNRAPRHKVATA
jgi:hypothetical protein